MSCSKCGHTEHDSDYSSDEELEILSPVYPNRPCLYLGCRKRIPSDESYYGHCRDQVPYESIEAVMDQWYADLFADLEKKNPGKLKAGLEEDVRAMAKSDYHCDGGFTEEYTDLYIYMNDKNEVALSGGKRYRIVLEEIKE